MKGNKVRVVAASLKGCEGVILEEKNKYWVIEFNMVPNKGYYFATPCVQEIDKSLCEVK